MHSWASVLTREWLACLIGKGRSHESHIPLCSVAKVEIFRCYILTSYEFVSLPTIQRPAICRKFAEADANVTTTSQISTRNELLKLVSLYGKKVDVHVKITFVL